MKFLLFLIFAVSALASSNKCQIQLLLEESYHSPLSREELLQEELFSEILQGYNDFISNPAHFDELFAKGEELDLKTDFHLLSDVDGMNAEVYIGELKNGQKVILKAYEVESEEQFDKLVAGALTEQFFANFELAPKVFGLLGNEDLEAKNINLQGSLYPNRLIQLAVVMEYIPDVVNFPKGDFSQIFEDSETTLKLGSEIDYFEEIGHKLESSTYSLEDRQLFFSKSRKKAYFGDFDEPLRELKAGEKAQSLYDQGDLEFANSQLDGAVSQFTQLYDIIGRKPQTNPEDEIKNIFSKFMRPGDFEFPEDFED